MTGFSFHGSSMADYYVYCNKYTSRRGSCQEFFGEALAMGFAWCYDKNMENGVSMRKGGNRMGCGNIGLWMMSEASTKEAGG